MSGYTESQLEPETLEHILYLETQSVGPCCDKRGDLWHLCTYHQGYDDGVARMREHLEVVIEVHRRMWEDR